MSRRGIGTLLVVAALGCEDGARGVDDAGDAAGDARPDGSGGARSDGFTDERMRDGGGEDSRVVLDGGLDPHSSREDAGDVGSPEVDAAAPGEGDGGAPARDGGLDSADGGALGADGALLAPDAGLFLDAGGPSVREAGPDGDAVGPDLTDAGRAWVDGDLPEFDGAPEGTSLTPDGRLVLRTATPRLAADCAVPCDDADRDGLNDAWEDRALDRLRPLLRLDEQEPLVEDADAVLAMVGRVTPHADGDVRFFLMVGYSRDYGSCFGATAHDGDSERVALRLRPVGPGDAEVVGAYTAAHENTPLDHGRVYTGDALAGLVHALDAETGAPRWVVFPSAGKHGTYADVATCEGISPLPCLDEDCGPDGVDDPARFERLPPYVNAGEPDAPLVDDLGPMGFPGDRAWADQPFCGGRPRGGCSAPVLEKLTQDPFE